LGIFTEGNEGNEGLLGRAVVSFLIFSLRCLPVHRLYEKADKLSREVIGAAIEVHRHRGPGLFMSRFRKDGISRMILPGANRTEETEDNEVSL
jgi:hypothetical protein